jgi:quercetin dioxygenase-like cupin family protein
MPDGEVLTLKKRDVVLLPVLKAAKEIRYSGDFDAVEIAAPGHGLVDDVAPLLKIPATAHTGSWEEGVCRNRKEAFLRGDGPRNFFTYRELGAVAVTSGRIKICDGDESGLGPVEIPEGGTGWHTHSMSQFFMILNGGEEIEVEGRGKIRMVTGDAMMLGEGTRHNVTSFTPDFSAFEMCLPGEYDTLPAKAP